MKIRLCNKKLAYLFIYFISWLIYFVLNVIIVIFSKAGTLYIYLYFITLGKIIGGLAIYIYLNQSFKRKKKTNYFGLELLHNKTDIPSTDKTYKIVLLIFFASVFDILFLYYNIFYRLVYIKYGCLNTIASSLICTYAFRNKVGKHQKVSLIIMGIFLVFAIIIEVCYYLKKLYLTLNFVLCYGIILVSFSDCTEKYLVEYNFVNPFKLLMFEGIFEFAMTIIISVQKNFVADFINAFQKEKNLIIIIVYPLIALSSAFLNIYKIYCNIIYSPMAKSLTDYLLTPFFNILFFLLIYENTNIAYIILTEIVSVVISFFGLVYNEFIIIYRFGLEYDTKEEISKRAGNLERPTKIVMAEMDTISDYDEEDIKDNELPY